MPRIDAVELYHVRMPLVYPFTTAYGSDDVIESILVKLISGNSYGWGEAQPFKAPTYCPEYSAGVLLMMRMYLVPAILGKQIESGDELQDRWACFKGNHFAKGGIDMAWWDLYARRRGEPLWKVLGGLGPEVEVGADFGVMHSLDALLEKIDGAVRAGYTRVKLKYAPGWDLGMVAAVRKAFPRMTFHIDCNSGYRLSDLDMFRRLDEYGLAMIEQPLMHDDLIDHASLARQIHTPICLDESITSLDRARQAIEIGACKWVNIKPVRVGGLTPALKINAYCMQAGVPCWVGGMLESALGAAHCLAMATLPNMKYPNDIFPSSRFYEKDLGRPEMKLSGPSRMTAAAVPGVGVEPDPEQLDRVTVQRVVMEA
ncbi:MAG TPA: o-succinylbenzoate synthase [Phycisphaerae bacterium]|nr:o-succinylbenzoate synthase [Phycisphaerae bacterium]HQE29129.1 o-succinylbenzoate synthase [Phycisphaerae bacterium]